MSAVDDKGNDVAQLLTVMHSSATDFGDFTKRLAGLVDLKDGWYYGEGKATTREAIDTAKHVWVGPSSDGGLMIELHAGGLDIEIDVRPDGGIENVSVTPSPQTRPAAT